MPTGAAEVAPGSCTESGVSMRVLTRCRQHTATTPWRIYANSHSEQSSPCSMRAYRPQAESLPCWTEDTKQLIRDAYSQPDGGKIPQSSLGPAPDDRRDRQYPGPYRVLTGRRALAPLRDRGRYRNGQDHRLRGGSHSAWPWPWARRLVVCTATIALQEQFVNQGPAGYPPPQRPGV